MSPVRLPVGPGRRSTQQASAVVQYAQYQHQIGLQKSLENVRTYERWKMNGSRSVPILPSDVTRKAADDELASEAEACGTDDGS